MSDPHVRKAVRGPDAAQRGRGRTWRAALSTLTTVAVSATGLMLAAVPAGAADGEVSGTVFRDFNGNGAFDTGNTAASGIANDLGLAGVTVTATDGAGAFTVTTTSAADGTYVLDTTGVADGTPLRIEFSGWPDAYEPSGTSSAGSNGTSVQFVAAGAEDVDFALNAPEDYSQGVVPVVTGIQSAGVPDAAVNPAVADFPALVSIPWTAQRTEQGNGAYPDRTTLATFSEVGSIGGIAYQDAAQDYVYAAAAYKRLAGLGAQGLGGIYRVPVTLDSAGNVATDGPVEQWLDVETLTIEGTGDLVDLGPWQTNAERGLGAANLALADADGFANSGKVGIGGITLSTDHRTLFFVNLHDRNLYAIDVSGTGAPTTATRIELGLEDDQRPWAVTVHRGEIHVGYVDTGDEPGVAAAEAELRAYVVTTDETAAFDGTAAWSHVLFDGGEAGLDLGYVKGNPVANWGNRDVAGLFPQILRWNTWADQWTWTGGSAGLDLGAGSSWGRYLQVYPQPILTGLAFDTDGFLQLGFADRNDLQGGNRNISADDVANVYYESVTSGDLILAGRQADGTFAPESNGTAAGIAEDGQSITRQASLPWRENNQGPGGGEFYNDTQYLGTGANHWENSLGSVAVVPGIDQVLSTSMDPLARARVSGLTWFSAGTGANSAGYTQTCSSEGCYGQDSASSTFQKGGGLGAVTLLTELAPVEIGNRVWFDADQNGIQDADEPAIAGVTVELYAADENGAPIGAPIQTTATDASGEYYFRSDDPQGPFDPTGEYVVVFVPPASGDVQLVGPNADAFGTLTWADLSFTEQVTDASATDSNADPATGYAPVTIDGPGYNDHTIDAGFVADASFDVLKVVSQDGGEPAAGQTFQISAAALDFRGQPFPLSQSQFTLEYPDDLRSATVTVPVGTQVSVDESGQDQYRSVDISPSGFQQIGVGDTFTFTVTNELREPGFIEVTKAVTGDFDLDSPELAGAVFTVAYSYAGGSGTLELDAANDWADISEAIPYGTPVTLTETGITGHPASVDFGTPTWTAGDNGDGTATVTVGDGATTQLVLTNPATELRNTFEVTKLVTGEAADRVPADTQFTIEYTLDPASGWTSLSPVTAGQAASPDDDFPVGTRVYLREVVPAPIDGVEWDDFVWGPGVTPATADEPASLVITAGQEPISVSLTNVTETLNGQFSLEKVVEGAAGVLADGLTYAIEYAYEGQAEPSPAVVTISADDPAWVSAPLPQGTEVTITEVGLDDSALPAGAEWGTPTLIIDGSPAQNGATLTIVEDTTLAVEVVNIVETTPSVEITKGDGDAEAGTIAHEADTVGDGEVYAPGESRDVVIRVVNTGPEPLREVVLTDDTLAGGVITNLVWTFPDDSTAAADLEDGTWTAQWSATFGDDPTLWQVGDVIVGTATLALHTGDGAHQDRATVEALGAYSGSPVDDTNDYNAFTGAIQVIKYDGERSDPVVRDSDDSWVIPAKPLLSESQDANTTATAVEYPVDTTQRVRWVVTNTGDTWLTNLTLEDFTLDGPAIGADWTADLTAFGGPADYSFVDDGAWPGLFPPGASFFAEGTLTLPAEGTHADEVVVVGTVVVPEPDADGVPTDQPSLDGQDTPVPATNDDGEPFTVTDDDPFHAYTGIGPDVEIRKGDGSGTQIVHEADTLADGEAYAPGETRTIVFQVENTGDETLVDVVLTDETIAGGAVQGLEWTLPSGDPLAAAFDEATGIWTARWEGPWQPGEIITGAATLTLGGASVPHVDRATVTASGIASGIPVADENDYNAFTGSIQVIKYDGNQPDPQVADGDDWVIPAKPLADADQDANDTDTAVRYPVGTTNPVRWVVTNTGATWLTDITLTDTTDLGPEIGEDWTADLSEFGGPADYSFVTDGPWTGLLPPGASFFAQGTLTLAANERHTNTVDVVGTVVVPATGDDGVTPSDEPLIDPDTDEPVRATIEDPENPGERIPFTVDDDDPFNAWTGEGPYVDIDKGDGTGTEIVHDADTNLTGELYEPGETRTIVFRVQNTGDEDLVEVVFTDENLSGTVVEELVWTLPDGSLLPATLEGSTWTARWEATFTGDAVWQPGEWVYGSATLTLGEGGEPHLDRASVEAVGIGSGIPVGDRDDYHAFTAGVQVIKYDGDEPDPEVRDADGNWIIPAKPLVDAGQDANDEDHSVEYRAGEDRTVRWVVTNTGSTWLTSLDLSDVTQTGPAVRSWTADLSAFGGPAAYDFVANGTWHGLIPPGASFFAEGALTLDEDETHADTVTVEATPVVPAVDDDGVPTGEPLLDENGDPVLVRDADGDPVRVTDSDPFHAHTPAPPLVITGADVLLWLLVAAVLAVLGIGFVALRGRRRGSHGA